MLGLTGLNNLKNTIFDICTSVFLFAFAQPHLFLASNKSAVETLADGIRQELQTATSELKARRCS